MRKSGLGRIAPLLAAVGWLGACADQPLPLGPLDSVASPLAEVGAAGEGELIICKVGNDVGTFTFNYSFVVNPTDPTPGPAVPGGSVNVAVGGCATIASPLTITDRYLATVTEQAPPVNWALTDLTVVLSGAGGDAPIIDKTNRTATVRVSNDQGATITFTNTFTPPPGGCTFTLGYWKTHSEFGPAPYNNTWAQLSNGASTIFYLSGASWYDVFHTAPAGNAYYNLAHQFQAATLNTLWGASVPAAVAAAMTAADGLFLIHTPAYIGTLKGTNALRQQFISLAGILGAYNEGTTGPGHCGA